MANKRWKITLSNNILKWYNPLFGQLKPKDTFDPKRIYTSIVIYSTTALGDLMFNTPAIRAIKERYPHAFITLVSSVKNKSMVEKCEYFSEVVYWDQKVKDLFQISWKIRKQRPQLAILLHSKLPYDVLSAAIAGCEYVIRDNYSPQPMGMELWLSDYSKAFTGHLIERKLKLVSVLGCDTRDTSMFVPAPFTPIKKDFSRKIIGFQMGASEPHRCWPVIRYVELAKKLLASNHQYEIALIGTSLELQLEQDFLSKLSDEEKSRTISYVNKTNLPQLLAQIDNFDVLVTGDTGPMHLAVALKTKTVCLFATAEPKFTGPFQDEDLHCIIKLRPEEFAPGGQPLASVSADKVFNFIEELTATSE